MAQHEAVRAVSGTVTCKCGYETPHAAHMDDAWDLFDKHKEKASA